MTPVVIVSRGDRLEAVTSETRAAVEAELVGLGHVLQVWTWRNGEAVVLRRPHTRLDSGQPVVVMRRGLRRGRPTTLLVDSVAAAFRAVGMNYRNRVRPSPAPRDSRDALRRRLLPAIRGRGNRWRTMRTDRGTATSGW